MGPLSGQHGTLTSWVRSSLTLSYVTIANGEVWANMLHNVYAQLVAQHGFSATAKTDPS